MPAEASREILWNVAGLCTVIIMYSLMLLSLALAAVALWRRIEFWKSGKAAALGKISLSRRLADLFSWGVAQRGVVRKPSPGVFHTLIYVGFATLLFTTTMVFLDHDLGIEIYRGRFYLLLTVLSDCLGFGVLVGCLLAAHRRYISQSKEIHSSLSDCLMLLLLSALIVQGFLLEGLRIHATQDPWAKYSPIGLLTARFFWAVSISNAELLHKIAWWFHTVTVFSFIALIPYTKFFHIISSPINLFFRSRERPKGALSFPGDIEKLVESGDDFSIGNATLKDYTWKQLLDLDACTSCGRCQEVCPAFLTGKPLSPKWLILDTRNHALILNAEGKLGESKLPAPLRELDRHLTVDLYLSSSGVRRAEDGQGYVANGEYRSENLLVQQSVKRLGASADQKIAHEVMEDGVFWSCTTCMACVNACPVGINHVDQIVEVRRNLTVMQGEVPSEAQKTLRALENRANPYGAPEDRIKWLEDLSVRILQPGDSVDYLYWVGCVSSFDPRKQKIARALVTLMKEAGLNFGILGTAEGCSGDPARRLGEENLFQTLAKKNIGTLASITFSTIVANCPHCFNTIKNEYPQLGNLGNGRSPEIIHHSQLLKRLLSQGKLKVKEGALERTTFHDPCYLGRYNDEYDAPREVLTSVSRLPIIEMENSRDRGLCCGAGGGHFWMDLKIGSRVNVRRAEEAAASGASQVATACPFCMQMMEDGIKLTNREEALKVRDLAEVLAENLLKQ